jgi:4-amino-4-deoxy-L-arabinose transferase-like glycosyltransferase
MNNFNPLRGLKPIFSLNIFKTNKDIFLLMLGAFILVFFMLNANVLWTAETRWASVCLEMQLRGDYFHPYRYGIAYYDKPLLSYWLILFFAALFLIAVYCTFKLGTNLINRKTGLLAGWLLVTTYFFVFWSRTATAEMMTVAGSMFAVLWYFEHKKNLSFKNYFIFFLITAVTSQTKGLIGFTIPVLAIAADLFQNKEWKKHLRLDFFVSLLLATVIYLIPFGISAYLPDVQSHSSGLSEVIRENFLRFFAPFDHKDPFFTYFIYLPVYVLPWTVLFIPAIVHAFVNWRKYNQNTRWLFKAASILFLFFTISGSRRSYYVLPLVPFASLISANWIFLLKDKVNYRKFFDIAVKSIFVVYFLLFIWFGITYPIIDFKYYGNLKDFVKNVKSFALNKNVSWNQYQILDYKSEDNRAIFYLKPEKPVLAVTDAELQQIFKNKKLQDKIIITTQENLAPFQNLIDRKSFIVIIENSKNKKENVAIFQANNESKHL